MLEKLLGAGGMALVAPPDAWRRESATSAVWAPSMAVIAANEQRETS